MVSEEHHLQTSPWQFRFSIASMLLATAVVAVCLAVARVHFGIGVLVSFLTIPALIRTALVATREASTDAPISAIGKILEFLFSWMLMLPIGLAALIVGGIALTLVSFAGYIVIEVVQYSWLPRQLEFLMVLGFAATSMTAGIGAGGIFIAWGIHSSLAYRPVAKI